MSHITGGGFPDNLPRVLPPDLDAVVHPEAWSWPPLFRFLDGQGARPSGRDAARLQLRDRHGPDRPAGAGPRREEAARRGGGGLEADRPRRRRARGRSGSCERRGRRSRRPAAAARAASRRASPSSSPGAARTSTRSAEACERGELPATIALVVSDVADAPGLARAETRGVPAVALDRAISGAKARASRRGAPAPARRGAGATSSASRASCASSRPAFVERWPLRILNVHPSLLPAFPGLERAGAGGSLRRAGLRGDRPLRRRGDGHGPDRRARTALPVARERGRGRLRGPPALRRARALRAVRSPACSRGDGGVDGPRRLRFPGPPGAR